MSSRALVDEGGDVDLAKVYRSPDGIGAEIPPQGNTQCRDYPFGNDKDASGTTNDYKFTGKEWDAESDLYYSWKRYYDPFTGRFISVDPLWQKYSSLSPYHYCANNPNRTAGKHLGTDYKADFGTDVKAVENGEVSNSA